MKDGKSFFKEIAVCVIATAIFNLIWYGAVVNTKVEYIEKDMGRVENIAKDLDEQVKELSVQIERMDEWKNNYGKIIDDLRENNSQRGTTYNYNAVLSAPDYYIAQSLSEKEGDENAFDDNNIDYYVSADNHHLVDRETGQDLSGEVLSGKVVL